MKNFTIILILVFVGVILLFPMFFPNHKNCPKTVFWNGKSTLGDPAVVMVVRNYHSAWEFNSFKRTSDPKIIDNLSQELYGKREGKEEWYEVFGSQYHVVYMAPSGSHMVVPIFIDNGNEVATSLRVKSHELWEILNSIDKTEVLGFDSMMEKFPKPHAPNIPKEE